MQVAQKENAHHGPLPNELKVVERFFLVLSKNNTKMKIDVKLRFKFLANDSHVVVSTTGYLRVHVSVVV